MTAVAAMATVTAVAAVAAATEQAAEQAAAAVTTVAAMTAMAAAAEQAAAPVAAEAAATAVAAEATVATAGLGRVGIHRHRGEANHGQEQGDAQNKNTIHPKSSKLRNRSNGIPKLSAVHEGVIPADGERWESPRRRETCRLARLPCAKPLGRRGIRVAAVRS
jgi:hypothetical protein